VTNVTVRAAKSSLREALKAIRLPGVREKLEGALVPYTAKVATPQANDPWPAFHFLLAGVGSAPPPDQSHLPLWSSGPLAPLPPAEAEVEEARLPEAPPSMSPAATQAAEVDRLTTLVGLALEGAVERALPLPFARRVANALTATGGDAGWFVVRFVYTRRDCGPLHPPAVSDPTQRFQLASFFDPDAPARPIRISLPIDTTPAGLRKFDKNTAFVVSDLLCGQMQRAKGMGLIDLVRMVLPWPLHKDLDMGDGGPCANSIGMICSLSIPIITICALILLMIIVSLLDLVFRWLPFFAICFPVPDLKGKKAAS
jgi:hypothetical protein